MKQGSQDDQDLMELEALLDCKVLQDFQAHQVKKDRMDPKAWTDSKETLDCVGGKAQRESGVMLEERVLMVSLVHQEKMELMEQLAIRERLGLMGLQDHQDLLDPVEVPVQLAHLDPKVSREHLGCPVFLEQKEPQVTQVSREKGANRVYQDDEVHRDPREKEELMVLLVKMARKGRKEHRVILDRLDHRDYQVPQENRATLVKMEPLGHQEPRVRLDHQALPAFLVRVAKGVIQAPRVNQGHEVPQDGKEVAASQEPWEHLVNKDLRVSVVPQELLELQDFLAKMVLQENQEPVAKMDKRENGVLMVFQAKMVYLVQGEPPEHLVIPDLTDEMARRVLPERMVNRVKLDHRALLDPMVAWECLARKENRVHLERQELLAQLDLKALRGPMVILETEEKLGHLELMVLLVCEVFQAQLVLQD